MLETYELPPYTTDLNSPLLQHNIRMVVRGQVNGKIPHLLARVKHFALSEADASITLTDPTGEIKGTVHRKVLDKYTTDQLMPGAVLVLQKVSVFSPTPRSHYLNLTPNNIVHLFTADMQPTHSAPAVPVRVAAPTAAPTPPAGAGAGEEENLDMLLSGLDDAFFADD
jgi:hypothetical protein